MVLQNMVKKSLISAQSKQGRIAKQGESLVDIEKLEKLGRIKIVHFDITTQ